MRWRQSRLPTVERLADDLRTAQVVAAGRPYRKDKTTPDLERVAKKVVVDPSLMGLGLCEAAIKEAVFALGEGPYAEAMQAIFGISDDAKHLPQLKDRSDLAAEKLHRKSLDEGYEKRMCHKLAETMLELAVEGRGHEARQRPDWRRAAAIAGLSLAAFFLVAGVWFMWGVPFSSPSGAESPTLSRLAAESRRQLDLADTPAPGNVGKRLGYGDAVGGRQTFPYSAATTTTYEPTFNALVDTRYAPPGGDERLFLWLNAVDLPGVKPKNNWPHRRRSVALSGDDAASVLVLVENSAAPQPRCGQLEGVSVAENSRLRVSVWHSPDGQLHVIRAWVSANNANPRWVTDAVAITTDEPAELDLAPKLSYIFSRQPAGFEDWPALRSEAVLRPAGMQIGHGERGLIGSCWENRFWYVLTFREIGIA